MARIFKKWFMTPETEIFLYGMAGITITAMEQSVANASEYLQEVQNAPLPAGYFGQTAEQRVKTILSLAVLARSLTVYVYLFSYFAVLGVAFFGHGRFILLPWLALSVLRHFVVDVAVAFTGLYICLKYQLTPVCSEFILMRLIRIGSSAYMWHSVRLLYADLAAAASQRSQHPLAAYTLSKEGTRLLNRALRRLHMRAPDEEEEVAAVVDADVVPDTKPSSTGDAGAAAAASLAPAAAAADTSIAVSASSISVGGAGRSQRRRTSEGIVGAASAACAHVRTAPDGQGDDDNLKLPTTRSLDSLLTMLDYNAEALAPLVTRRREERRAGEGATPRQRALLFLRLTDRDTAMARRRTFRALVGPNSSDVPRTTCERSEDDDASKNVSDQGVSPIKSLHLKPRLMRRSPSSSSGSSSSPKQAEDESENREMKHMTPRTSGTLLEPHSKAASNTALSTSSATRPTLFPHPPPDITLDSPEFLSQGRNPSLRKLIMSQGTSPLSESSSNSQMSPQSADISVSTVKSTTSNRDLLVTTDDTIKGDKETLVSPPVTENTSSSLSKTEKSKLYNVHKEEKTTTAVPKQHTLKKAEVGDNVQVEEDRSQIEESRERTKKQNVNLPKERDKKRGMSPLHKLSSKSQILQRSADIPMKPATSNHALLVTPVDTAKGVKETLLSTSAIKKNSSGLSENEKRKLYSVHGGKKINTEIQIGHSLVKTEVHDNVEVDDDRSRRAESRDRNKKQNENILKERGKKGYESSTRESSKKGSDTLLNEKSTKLNDGSPYRVSKTHSNPKKFEGNQSSDVANLISVARQKSPESFGHRRTSRSTATPSPLPSQDVSHPNILLSAGNRTPSEGTTKDDSLAKKIVHIKPDKKHADSKVAMLKVTELKAINAKSDVTVSRVKSKTGESKAGESKVTKSRLNTVPTPTQSPNRTVVHPVFVADNATLRSVTRTSLFSHERASDTDKFHHNSSSLLTPSTKTPLSTKQAISSRNIGENKTECSRSAKDQGILKLTSPTQSEDIDKTNVLESNDNAPKKSLSVKSAAAAKFYSSKRSNEPTPSPARARIASLKKTVHNRSGSQLSESCKSSSSDDKYPFTSPGVIFRTRTHSGSGTRRRSGKERALVKGSERKQPSVKDSTSIGTNTSQKAQDEKNSTTALDQNAALKAGTTAANDSPRLDEIISEAETRTQDLKCFPFKIASVTEKRSLAKPTAVDSTTNFIRELLISKLMDTVESSVNTKNTSVLTSLLPEVSTSDKILPGDQRVPTIMQRGAKNIVCEDTDCLKDNSMTAKVPEDINVSARTKENDNACESDPCARQLIGGDGCVVASTYLKKFSPPVKAEISCEKLPCDPSAPARFSKDNDVTGNENAAKFLSSHLRTLTTSDECGVFDYRTSTAVDDILPSREFWRPGGISMKYTNLDEYLSFARAESLEERRTGERFNRKEITEEVAVVDRNSLTPICVDIRSEFKQPTPIQQFSETNKLSSVEVSPFVQSILNEVLSVVIQASSSKECVSAEPTTTAESLILPESVHPGDLCTSSENVQRKSQREVLTSVVQLDLTETVADIDEMGKLNVRNESMTVIYRPISDERVATDSSSESIKSTFQREETFCNLYSILETVDTASEECISKANIPDESVRTDRRCVTTDSVDSNKTHTAEVEKLKLPCEVPYVIQSSIKGDADAIYDAYSVKASNTHKSSRAADNSVSPESQTTDKIRSQSGNKHKLESEEASSIIRPILSDTSTDNDDSGLQVNSIRKCAPLNDPMPRAKTDSIGDCSSKHSSLTDPASDHCRNAKESQFNHSLFSKMVTPINKVCPAKIISRTELQQQTDLESFSHIGEGSTGKNLLLGEISAMQKSLHHETSCIVQSALKEIVDDLVVRSTTALQPPAVVQPQAKMTSVTESTPTDTRDHITTSDFDISKDSTGIETHALHETSYKIEKNKTPYIVHSVLRDVVSSVYKDISTGKTSPLSDTATIDATATFEKSPNEETSCIIHLVLCEIVSALNKECSAKECAPDVIISRSEPLSYQETDSSILARDVSDSKNSTLGCSKTFETPTFDETQEMILDDSPKKASSIVHSILTQVVATAVKKVFSVKTGMSARTNLYCQSAPCSNVNINILARDLRIGKDSIRQPVCLDDAGMLDLLPNQESSFIVHSVLSEVIPEIVSECSKTQISPKIILSSESASNPSSGSSALTFSNSSSLYGTASSELSEEESFIVRATLGEIAAAVDHVHSAKNLRETTAYAQDKFIVVHDTDIDNKSSCINNSPVETVILDSSSLQQATSVTSSVLTKSVAINGDACCAKSDVCAKITREELSACTDPYSRNIAGDVDVGKESFFEKSPTLHETIKLSESPSYEALHIVQSVLKEIIPTVFNVCSAKTDKPCKITLPSEAVPCAKTDTREPLFSSTATCRLSTTVEDLPQSLHKEVRSDNNDLSDLSLRLSNFLPETKKHVKKEIVKNISTFSSDVSPMGDEFTSADSSSAAKVFTKVETTAQEATEADGMVQKSIILNSTFPDILSEVKDKSSPLNGSNGAANVETLSEPVENVHPGSHGGNKTGAVLLPVVENEVSNPKSSYLRESGCFKQRDLSDAAADSGEIMTSPPENRTPDSSPAVRSVFPKNIVSGPEFTPCATRLTNATEAALETTRKCLHGPDSQEPVSSQSRPQGVSLIPKVLVDVHTSHHAEDNVGVTTTGERPFSWMKSMPPMSNPWWSGQGSVPCCYFPVTSPEMPWSDRDFFADISMTRVTDASGERSTETDVDGVRGPPSGHVAGETSCAASADDRNMAPQDGFQDGALVERTLEGERRPAPPRTPNLSHRRDREAEHGPEHSQ